VFKSPETGRGSRASNVRERQQDRSPKHGFEATRVAAMAAGSAIESSLDSTIQVRPKDLPALFRQPERAASRACRLTGNKGDALSRREAA
jgi:hypothetical protein